MKRTFGILASILLVLSLIILAARIGMEYGQKQAAERFAKEKAEQERAAAREAEANARADAEAARLAAEAAAAEAAAAMAESEELIAPESDSWPAYNDTFEFGKRSGKTIRVTHMQADSNHPRYTHAICDDGDIHAVSYRSTSPERHEESGIVADDLYDFPKETQGSGTCLLVRNLDPGSFRSISWNRGRACVSATEGCQKFPLRDCTLEDKNKILGTVGYDKDEIRFCQVIPAGDRYTFMQTLTRNGNSCQQRLWILDPSRPHILESEDNGRFGSDRNGRPDITATSCIFSVGETENREGDFVEIGGPLSIPAFFEIGGKSYVVMEAINSAYSRHALIAIGEGERKLIEYFDADGKLKKDNKVN